MEQPRGDLRKVLVVDDDPDAAGLAAYHFRQAGYDVVLAADAAHAMTEVNRQRFDLIVLDMLLPDQNGDELLEALRASANPDCPVVISSVLDRDQYPTDIFAALPKPIGRAGVVDVVAKLDAVAS